MFGTEGSKMHDAPVGLATLIGIYFVGIEDSGKRSESQKLNFAMPTALRSFPYDPSFGHSYFVK